MGVEPGRPGHESRLADEPASLLHQIESLSAMHDAQALALTQAEAQVRDADAMMEEHERLNMILELEVCAICRRAMIATQRSTSAAHHL